MVDNLSARTIKYFIGANTSRGFINYGDMIFEDLKKLYVIKGGPGTGKSTFMKRFAESAEAIGCEVEYYYCSSDPSSLDGIVIPKLKLGITDGTSPHTFEARYPGAKEEYLNLGEFWNADFLALCRDQIEALTKQKAKLFSSAYKYLSVAESVRGERERVLLSCYNYEKSEKAIGRLMKKMGTGKGYELVTRQISAFSMAGEAVFDTFENEAKRVIYIKDKRGVSSFLFNEIVKRAEVLRLITCVSYDPLCRINAVMFPEKGVAILLGEGDTVINAERFVIQERLRDVRKKLRFLNSLENELKDSALKDLNQARGYHFSLEDIYKEAMDFISLEKMEKAFISKALK